MSIAEVPNDWTVVELGSLRAPVENSLVGGPFGSDLTTVDYQSEPGIPVIRGSNLSGETGSFVEDGFVFVSEEKANLLQRHIALPGDVIFTQRGTLGQVVVIPSSSRFSRYLISQSQMKLTTDPAKIDRRFLFHYFRSPGSLERIVSKTLATGVPHINLGILKTFPVLCPPLDEQRRIADVLDRVEALRAKRRAALAQLDMLTQSVFLEFFGDPVTNPKEWLRKPLGEIGTVITGNTPARANSDFFGSAIEWIKSDNINTPHYYLTMAEEYLSEAGKSVARLAPIGSILVTCIAGSPDCIGNAAMANREVAFNQQINAVVPREGNPHFLYAQILVGKALIQRASTGGMKGMVSKSRFEAINLIFPPLSAQDKFARRVAAVEKLKAAHRASLAELDALFASLQHRAFQGEL